MLNRLIAQLILEITDKLMNKIVSFLCKCDLKKAPPPIPKTFIRP